MFMFAHFIIMHMDSVLIAFFNYLAVLRCDAEEKMNEVMGMKSNLEKKAQEAEDAVQKVQDDLRLMTSEKDETVQEKWKLEVRQITVILMKEHFIKVGCTKDMVV